MQSSAAMFRTLVQTIGNVQATNFAFQISTDGCFVWLVNPSAGGSRLRRALEQAIAQDRARHAPAPGQSTVGQPEFISPGQYGVDRLDALIEDPEVIKFTFLRGVLQRFAASYLEVIAPPGGGEPRQRLYRLLEMRPEQVIAPAELARLLAEDDEVRDLIPPFRLQRRQVAFDLIEFDFIGRHETLSADLASLLPGLFGTGIALEPFGTDALPRRTAELLDSLSPATLAVLEQAYAQDIDMLDEVMRSGPERAARWRRFL